MYLRQFLHHHHLAGAVEEVVVPNLKGKPALLKGCGHPRTVHRAQIGVDTREAVKEPVRRLDAFFLSARRIGGQIRHAKRILRLKPPAPIHPLRRFRTRHKEMRRFQPLPHRPQRNGARRKRPRNRPTDTVCNWILLMQIPSPFCLRRPSFFLKEKRRQKRTFHTPLYAAANLCRPFLDRQFFLPHIPAKIDFPAPKRMFGCI